MGGRAGAMHDSPSYERNDSRIISLGASSPFGFYKRGTSLHSLHAVVTYIVGYQQTYNRRKKKRLRDFDRPCCRHENVLPFVVGREPTKPKKQQGALPRHRRIAGRCSVTRRTRLNRWTSWFVDSSRHGLRMAACMTECAREGGD